MAGRGGNVFGAAPTTGTMTISPRSFLTGCGLAAVLATGGTAVAGPKLPTKPTTSVPKPQINPSIFGNQGLTGSVELTPRALYKGNVSMNVHRALRVEATSNRVKMDKSTQLWIHFKGAANTEYDVECSFSGSKSILVMDYASGKFVRQQSTTPSGGKLHHKVFARPGSEDRKVYMQASGNLDWLSCTVAPG